MGRPFSEKTNTCFAIFWSFHQYKAACHYAAKHVFIQQGRQVSRKVEKQSLS